MPVIKDHVFTPGNPLEWELECSVDAPVKEAGQWVRACCGYPPEDHAPVSDPIHSEWCPTYETDYSPCTCYVSRLPVEKEAPLYIGSIFSSEPGPVFQLSAPTNTVIFTVARDGMVSFGPGVTPEVAAQAFWTHVGNVATKYQDRLNRLKDGINTALESLAQNSDPDTVTIHLLKSTLTAVENM